MKYFSFLEKHPYYAEHFDNSFWVHYFFVKDGVKSWLMIKHETFNIDYVTRNQPIDPEWFLEIVEQVEEKIEKLTRLRKLTTSKE